MTRLIDADELKKQFLDEPYGSEEIRNVIDNAPTVEEVSVIEFKEPLPLVKAQKIVKALSKRPQGEWERDDEHSITFDIFKCSHCGGWGATHFRFCPNCGADMRGDAKNG